MECGLQVLGSLELKLLQKTSLTMVLKASLGVCFHVGLKFLFGASVRSSKFSWFFLFLLLGYRAGIILKGIICSTVSAPQNTMKTIV